FHYNEKFPDRANEKPLPIPEIEAENPETYEISEIRDFKISRGKDYYLVHWKGYGDYDDEWVKSDNIEASELIKEFHKKYPEAREQAKQKTVKRRKSQRGRM